MHLLQEPNNIFNINSQTPGMTFVNFAFQSQFLCLQEHGLRRQNSPQAHSFRDRAAKVAQDVRALKRAVSNLSTEVALSSDLSAGQSEADKAARSRFHQLMGNKPFMFCYNAMYSVKPYKP